MLSSFEFEVLLQTILLLEGLFTMYLRTFQDTGVYNHRRTLEKVKLAEFHG
jgi:hypothetical protein